MKTAISIPDTVYESAEKLASRLGQSRSQLYTKALRSYVEKHQDEQVTDKLNDVYGSVESAMDTGLLKLQTQSLPNKKW